jgi:hypothetical protein
MKKITSKQLRTLIEAEVQRMQLPKLELSEGEESIAYSRAAELSMGYYISVDDRDNLLKPTNPEAIAAEQLLATGMREVGMESDLAAWEKASYELVMLVEEYRMKLSRQEEKTNKVVERVMQKYQAKVDRRRSGK